MKKVLPLILVLIGAALLITAVVFWIDSSTSTQSDSFGKSLRDWITLILGIGASLKGWTDLFKKEKPTPPTTTINIKDGNQQISTGDHARNIQAETYIENQTVQQVPEPKTPKSLSQLPAPPLDFIGREKELAQLRQNIEKGVLISGVQGMGGIGKTALGLKLAEQISPNYPDGQIYLDLRGAHEQMPLTPEQVMAHVIRSYYPEAALRLDFGELVAMYRSVLGGKRALLFFDNARNENQLKDLLPPRSCVLFVTSRHYFTLPGLAVIDLETLSPTDSVALVQEIVPKVSDEEADALARQCGYLPLAIRTATSILLVRPDLPTPELINRLKDNSNRLNLVENSLRLSYELLDDNLRNYLKQLCVFNEPFGVDAIKMIWSSHVPIFFRLGNQRLGFSGIDMTFLFEERLFRYNGQESLAEKTDKAIGELVKTSLLRFNENHNKYYFHDLVKLFLEERFLEDEDSKSTIENFIIYSLNTLEKLLKILGDLELSLVDSSAEGIELRYTSFVGKTPLEKYKFVFQQNLVELGKRFYSSNFSQTIPYWDVYVEIQKDILNDINSLEIDLATTQFLLTKDFEASNMSLGIPNPWNIKRSEIIRKCTTRIQQFRKKYFSFLNSLLGNIPQIKRRKQD